MTQAPLRVLLVEDSLDDAELVLRELRKGGYEPLPERVASKPAMQQALEDQVWDLIICDHLMPGFGSSQALELVRNKGIETPVIVVSGVAPEELVTTAMRAGARDFVSKHGLVRLVPAIRRELQEAASHREGRRIASRLAESEGRYESLFHENPAPMLLVDAMTLLVVDANRTAAVFFGHSLAALKQATIQAISDCAGCWKEAQRAKEQSSFQFPDRMLCGDGSYREIDVYAVKITQGRRAMLLATLFDQTERRKAEEHITRLAAAVDQVADAIAIMDASGLIEYVNHAFEVLTGFPLGVVRGWVLQDLLEHPEILEAVAKAAGGGSWEGKVAIRVAESTIKDVAITCSPVRDSSRMISNLVVVMRDITSEMELERHLRQTHRMDALGTLAAGVAHDFNNALTTILTAAELIQESLPSESPLQAKMDAIRQAGMCASGLTRQILSFSRDAEEKLLPMDLSAIVNSGLRMLRSTQPLDISIESSITSGIWVEGDATQLHQVVLNLAINAFQAMKDTGGHLRVSLGETAGSEELEALGLSGNRYACLTVRDTGCGMDARLLERIFDPFFTTKPAGEGTGLGLSMVHAAVTKAGGKIKVQSRPGEGTSFHVYWPCVTGKEQPSGDQDSEDVSGQESILFVDDEELVAALAKMGLQSLGYRVTTRTNAMAALEEFRLHPGAYDLVCTDLAMPELNGAELAAEIKALRSEIPILLVSGLPLAKALPLSARARFQGVVSKPFTAYDLAFSARKLLKPRLKSAVRTGPVTEASEGASRKEALILLAEDSHMTRGMIRTWLEKAGYKVRAAQDGMEAWDLFTNGPDRNRFDLLLTDVVMPRLDGMELIRLVRKADASLPIAILTSNEDKETVKSALHLGVNEFLNKPFEAPELLACVDRLMTERSSRVEERRSAETAQAVRMAQQAMVAVPEKDLPLFSLYEPLKDAGGDVFRCMKCADGSILFILADVAGHSVLSSYAVAAFLAMLSTFVQECVSLMALPAIQPGEMDRSKCLSTCGLYGHIPCQPLQHLARKFNQGIQNGPFSEIPVCTLLGQWNPASGTLHLLNAGIPHGLLAHKADGRVEILEINGTPLGIFPEPLVEETTLHLEPGDRVLFGTDGFFDVSSAERKLFQDEAAGHWAALEAAPIDLALSEICRRARDFGDGIISDDLLVIGFEQLQTERGPEELVLHFPSTPRAIDMACVRLDECIKAMKLGPGCDASRRFDISIAVREALTNAVIHGNRSRSEAVVTLRCWPGEARDRVLIAVADEGKGFDLEAHRPPEDPLSERGRGIPLIRAYAQNVRMQDSELTMTFLLEEDLHDGQQISAAR